MESTRFKQYMILSALFAGTLMAVTWWGTPARLAGPRVSLDLPAQVGEWTGHTMYYCQSEACLGSYTGREVTQTNVCPVCGAPLDTAALGERRLLPNDTEIRHRLYERSTGETMSVAVVVSGSGRASIHRPEWCLPGQGFRIADSRVVSVPVVGRDPIPASLLELRMPGGGGAASRNAEFLYWFVGAEREVARHAERLFWMAWQNLFHNTRYRWAYVAVATDSRGASGDHPPMLFDFAGAFYARILADQ